MKRIALLAAALLLFLTGGAQEKEEDFSSFMKAEMENFDRFMEDADRDFVNFMRNPWKEFDAQKPIEKRVKPEPVKPIVYKKPETPDEDKPVCLTIEEILDETTREGKQNPVVKVIDVDDITFDKPIIIVKQKDKPKVIVMEEEQDKPEVKPEEQPQPSKKPIVVVEPGKEKNAPEQEPVKRPAEEVKQPVQPEKPSTPSVPSKPVRQNPLYTGASGRKALSYGGQTFYVRNALKGQCRLSGLSENSVANAYESLYQSDWKPLVADCKQIASELRLNDWGVFTLLKALSDTNCSNENESVVMQQFLLNAMGYKARMARKGDGSRMLLFVATDCIIYGHPYTRQGGVTYYNINGQEACSFYMCQKDAPNAKYNLQMHLKSAPALSGKTVKSTHQAHGSTAKVTLEIPQALMDFYKSYPQCDYGIYATSTVNPEVEQQLLSSLAPYLTGKTETEAANILINFVQTAFQYATDDQQFGYEKPFFVEELFYYPYSDCEDRSVLFAYLVRKLMGLDVVFLDYPNHIATAVHFNGEVGGDYLMVDGKRYTVCDPTYIGASIGMTMPQFKTVPAKVLKY